MKKTPLSLLVAIGLIGSASAELATTDTFGTGANQFSLDFRTIGNTGNAADPLTGYGAVGYNYRIGTYNVSTQQVTAALGVGTGWYGNQPGTLNWYGAAAFVNWLNTSKGFLPAYNLTSSGSTWSMDLWKATDNGYDANNLYRNSLAEYFLPSENEWYKAAYGKSDGSGYFLYTTASDTAPTSVESGTTAGTAVFTFNGVAPQVPSSVYEAGGLSSYGTMGQGGNVWQWVESAYSGNNTDPSDSRAFRGGNYPLNADALQSSARFSIAPDYPNFDFGFRVASVVPEPSTYALFGLGALALVIAYRRKVA